MVCFSYLRTIDTHWVVILIDSSPLALFIFIQAKPAFGKIRSYASTVQCEEVYCIVFCFIALYYIALYGFHSLNSPYWRCYYANTDAVIYVVDSSDHERIGIAKNELVSMLEVAFV